MSAARKEINCLRNVISDSQSIFPFMVSFAILGTAGGGASLWWGWQEDHFSSNNEATVEDKDWRNIINKIMSTRWHLRPHLIRLDCGIQCFERHDGYERFIGKFSCQCSVFIRVSLAVQIRLWQGEPRSAMWFRSYGGNGVVLTMKTEQNTSLCSVLWSSSSSIASALSIRKLQSSLHYTANIINLGGDKSEETLIIMLTLCLLFQETQFEVSNIKLEGFSKC